MTFFKILIIEMILMIPFMASGSQPAANLNSLEIKTDSGREQFVLNATGVLKLGDTLPDDAILDIFLPYATPRRGSVKLSYEFAPTAETAEYLCSLANINDHGPIVFETLKKAEPQTVIVRTQNGFELQMTAGDTEVIGHIQCRSFSANSPKNLAKELKRFRVSMPDGSTQEGSFEVGEIDYAGPAQINGTMYGPRVLLNGAAYYVTSSSAAYFSKNICAALGLVTNITGGGSRTLAKPQSVVQFEPSGARLVKSGTPPPVFDYVSCYSSTGGGDGSH